ncbi:Translocon-associated protein subunit alpha-like protein [Drosera capensis]
MAIRVFLLTLLLFASPFFQVARCESEESESETVHDGADTVGEVGDVGIVNDDAQFYADESFGSAAGVQTVCVFPKTPGKLVPAGEETELLVGIKYDGDSSVNVIAIKASVHLPFDHSLLVQNLTAQIFNNASVPPSAQATFPYVFAVSKYLQAGAFDLVGTIVYEIDQQPYQSTFFNGTVEVIEPSGFLSMETVLLVLLGLALVAALGLWIRGQVQNLSKKSKRAPKVEVGTRSTEASMDEWLQGTAYTQSLSNKSKKKK